MPTIGGRLQRRDVDGAIRHPTGRRPAPGRRARWLEIQGDRCVGYRRAASNGADEKRGSRLLSASPEPQGVLPRAGLDTKSRSGDRKIAERGFRKATRWGRETAPYLVAE